MGDNADEDADAIEVPVAVSSIGYRHSRLSSFGTSNFFKKICVYPHGDIFIRYLRSSGPHLLELLLYSCYVSFTLLQSLLAGAVALFVLRLLHSTKFFR